MPTINIKFDHVSQPILCLIFIVIITLSAYTHLTNKYDRILIEMSNQNHVLRLELAQQKINLLDQKIDNELQKQKYQYANNSVSSTLPMNELYIPDNSILANLKQQKNEAVSEYLRLKISKKP